MRVLMTAGFYDLSGASIVIENLSEKLCEKGIQVVVGALSFKHLPTKKSYGFTVIPFGNVLKLKKFLDSFDILHNHHPILNYLGLVSHMPFIYHYHGAPNIGKENLFRLSMLASVKITNHRFDAVLTVSEAGYSELKRHLNPNLMHVVYNGVDTRLFRPTVEDIFRKGTPQCLFVGNLYDHKKVDELLLALKKLIKKYPRAHLQIVGKGVDLEKLENLTSRLNIQNSVSFEGAVPHNDLTPYYASCDVYVTASRCELFPLPLIEAWACGKPVVASSIPAHQELLSLSEAGEIYRTGDVGDLCEKLSVAYENNDKYKENALQFATEHDWTVVADEVLRLYKEILYN